MFRAYNAYESNRKITFGSCAVFCIMGSFSDCLLSDTEYPDWAERKISLGEKSDIFMKMEHMRKNRFLCMILAVLMISSVFALASCNSAETVTEETTAAETEEKIVFIRSKHDSEDTDADDGVVIPEDQKKVVTVSVKADDVILAGSCDEYAVEYMFDNTDPGSAAGFITIKNTGNARAAYEVYWGAGGEKLKNYSAIADFSIKSSTEDTFEMHKYSAIPREAEQLFISGKRTNIVIDLPKNKLATGEMIYSFGAGSDLHVQYEKIEKALSFLVGQGIDAYVASGDLTQDGTDNEFLDVCDTIKRVLGDTIPFYSTKGNHDINVSNEIWGEEFDTDTPLYYAKEINGETFVFMGMVAWTNPFAEGALDWLEQLLAEKDGQRVYIFEHLFLMDTVSSLRNTAGAIIYPNGNLMALTDPNDIRFRALIDQYPNVFHFSGHSHWIYRMQEYDVNANIYSAGEENGTYVHISGLGTPLMSDGKTTRETAGADVSEGMLVEVYDDYIIIKGVDHYAREFVSYACYIVPLVK